MYISILIHFYFHSASLLIVVYTAQHKFHLFFVELQLVCFVELDEKLQIFLRLLYHFIITVCSNRVCTVINKLCDLMLNIFYQFKLFICHFFLHFGVLHCYRKVNNFDVVYGIVKPPGFATLNNGTFTHKFHSKWCSK